MGPTPHGLGKSEITALSEIGPRASAAHILLEWTGIVVAVLLLQRWWHPALYVLGVAWIGARQHALAVLMHDGAHYRLFRRRWLNDGVSELLLAWPLGITMRAYRRSHLAHHRFLNTDDDPDWARKTGDAWRFPTSRWRLARMLLLDALGANGWVQLLTIVALSRPGKPRDRHELRQEIRYHLLRAAYYLCACVLLGKLVAFRLALLYWIVPMFSWLVLVLHVRSIAEHFGIAHGHIYNESRTTRPTLLERLLLGVKNAGYHLEHHLYPSVPLHRLPELHARLMKRAAYRDKAHVTSSYWRVLRECVGDPRVASTASAHARPSTSQSMPPAPFEQRGVVE